MTPDWHDSAACRGHPIGLFFIEDGERRIPFHERRQLERPARAICSACPVRSDCLEWAMTVGEKHGIWGGLNPAERKRLADSLAGARG